VNSGYTYILSNYKRIVLYIGVTNDLYTRLHQHKNGEGSKFAARYKCFDLVHFEVYHRITDAIDREKQLKRWHKEWKWNLVKDHNPDLKDLSDQI
jgi:putative endonuclease